MVKHRVSGGGARLNGHRGVNRVIRAIDESSAASAEAHGGRHVPAIVARCRAIRRDVVEHEHVRPCAANAKHRAQGVLHRIVSGAFHREISAQSRSKARWQRGLHTIVVKGRKRLARVGVGAGIFKRIVVSARCVACEKRPLTSRILGRFKKLSRRRGELAARGAGGAGARALADVTLGGWVGRER